VPWKANLGLLYSEMGQQKLVSATDK